jgi:hypothetical protein
MSSTSTTGVARQDLLHSAVPLLDHVQLPKHEQERRASSEATKQHPQMCETSADAFRIVVG